MTAHWLEEPSDLAPSLALTMTCASRSEAKKIVTYEVVHWISGRIRLHVPRLAYDAKFARRLSDTILTLPGLKEARVSPASSSLVVTYRCSSNNGDQQADQSILPLLIDCLCVAGGTVVAQLAPRNASMPVARQQAALPSDPLVNYLERVTLPTLGLALSAGVLAGIALPGVLVGAVILAAALPIFKRTLQGIQEEKRLTVDFLDATAIVLLTAQSSFLAPAFIVGVIEGSEILRDWTARRSRQSTLDLLLS